MLREATAKREATWAADRAEQLQHLRDEANFCVRSNRQQQEEAMAHRRRLERERLVTNREKDLAERKA